jgi:hypothetical protein
LVRGIPASKPATQVDAETSITLAEARDEQVLLMYFLKFPYLEK